MSSMENTKCLALSTLREVGKLNLLKEDNPVCHFIIPSQRIEEAQERNSEIGFKNQHL